MQAVVGKTLRHTASSSSSSSSYSYLPLHQVPILDHAVADGIFHSVPRRVNGLISDVEVEIFNTSTQSTRRHISDLGALFDCNCYREKKIKMTN